MASRVSSDGLDDMTLTLEAAGAYLHLARRAAPDGLVSLSYADLGAAFRKNYPNASGDTLRRLARRGIAELEEAGLVKVERRPDEAHGHLPNVYRVAPLTGRVT